MPRPNTIWAELLGAIVRWVVRDFTDGTCRRERHNCRPRIVGVNPGLKTQTLATRRDQARISIAQIFAGCSDSLISHEIKHENDQRECNETQETPEVKSTGHFSPRMNGKDCPYNTLNCRRDDSGLSLQSRRHSHVHQLLLKKYRRECR